MNFTRLLALVASIIVFSLDAFASTSSIKLILDTGGHTSTIRNLLYVSDNTLLSGGDDARIREWDIQTGLAIRSFSGQVGEGTLGQITAMALSTDQKWLAQAVFYPRQTAEQGEVRSYVRLFQYPQGNLVRVLKGQKQVIHSLQFSNDSRYIIGSEALAFNPTIFTWKVADGSIAQRFIGHKDQIISVRLDPQMQTLVSASWDKTIKTWDFATGQQLISKKADKFRVSDMDLSANGKYAVTVGRDRLARLWRVSDGKLMWKKTFSGAMYRAAFSADGQYIIIGSDLDKDKAIEVRVLDASNGKTLSSTSGWDYNIAAIQSHGSQVAVAGGTNNIIKIYQLPSLTEIRQFNGIGSAVNHVGISSEAKYLSWGNIKPDEKSMTLFTDKHGTLSPPTLLRKKISVNTALHALDGLKLSVGYGKKRRFKNVLTIKKGLRKIGKVVKTVETGNRHSAYGINPPGDQIISGGSVGKLYGYNTKGEMLGQFKGHGGRITDLALSSNGNYLVTASADQTVRLWNPQTYELLISIFSASNGEWVIWSPAGYYTSSPNGDRLFGWLISHGPNKASEFVKALQLKNQLFRPDIIDLVVKEGSLEQALNFLNVEPFSITNQLISKSNRPPQINNTDWSNNQATLFLNDFGQGIQNLKIYRNSRFVVNVDDPEIINGKIIIPLSHDNLFNSVARVVVKNSNGIDESLVWYASINKQTTQPKLTIDAPKGVLYYASIGINNFTNLSSQFSLENAAADADDITRVLLGTISDQYTDVKGIVLNDHSLIKPTKDAILVALDTFRQAGPNDTVVLFIASHGVKLKDGNYYFLPQDIELDNTAELDIDTSTAISWKVFQSVLENTRGRRYFFVDTCYAEKAFNPRLIKDSADAEVIAFNSTDAETLAIDSGILDLKNGLFTHTMLEALDGKADTENNGNIKIEEFLSYVTKRVTELSDGSQIPTSYQPAWIKDEIFIESVTN